jgi:hypothetical protein
MNFLRYYAATLVALVLVTALYVAARPAGDVIPVESNLLY